MKLEIQQQNGLSIDSQSTPPHPKKSANKARKKKPFWTNNKSRCEKVNKWSHDKYESDDEEELVVIGIPASRFLE